MLSKLKKDEKGFTIIEVMIVLAIAGLILLIVFLAVPALQRNSRNTQRNSEGAKVAASASECLNNRNGQASGCSTAASIAWSASEYQQLTTSPSISVTATAPAGPSTSKASIWFGHACLADGSNWDTTASTNSRAYAVVFKLEPNVTKCVSAT